MAFQLGHHVCKVMNSDFFVLSCCPVDESIRWVTRKRVSRFPIPATEIWFDRVGLSSLDISTREEYELLFDQFEEELLVGAAPRVEDWITRPNSGG